MVSYTGDRFFYFIFSVVFIFFIASMAILMYMFWPAFGVLLKMLLLILLTILLFVFVHSVQGLVLSK